MFHSPPAVPFLSPDVKRFQQVSRIVPLVILVTQNWHSYAASVNWNDADLCLLRKLLHSFYLPVKSFSEIVRADCLYKVEACQELEISHM